MSVKYEYRSDKYYEQGKGSPKAEVRSDKLYPYGKGTPIAECRGHKIYPYGKGTPAIEIKGDKIYVYGKGSPVESTAASIDGLPLRRFLWQHLLDLVEACQVFELLRRQPALALGLANVARQQSHKMLSFVEQALGFLAGRDFDGPGLA